MKLIIMGDMSNYYQELAMKNQFNYTHDYGYDETDYSIWTTKSGQKIPVIKMTDSHLINTINFINRNANESTEKWFDTLVIEANKRKLSTPTKSHYFECDASEIDLY